MRRFHQIFGLLLIIVFLLTGQYMDRYHNHMIGVEDGVRMLYRTRHIFILLAGLLNLGIGAYFNYRPEFWRRMLQVSGSGLIILASFLFIIAFFYEPTLTGLYTPLSHWGTYTIFAGTLCHLLSGARQLKDDAPR
jgi:O-antigen ligase